MMERRINEGVGVAEVKFWFCDASLFAAGYSVEYSGSLVRQGLVWDVCIRRWIPGLPFSVYVGTA